MRYLLLIIISCLLMACSSSSGSPPPPPNTGKYAPEINSQPKYFMTIEGHIDPIILKKHVLNFIADYYTNYKECEYMFNEIEGIANSRKQSLIKIPLIDQSGKYKVKIPLDQYKNGFCDWNLFTIGFQLSNSNLDFVNIMAFFEKGSKNKKYNIYDKIKCNSHQCSSIIPPFLDTNYLLSPKANYIYKLDIY